MSTTSPACWYFGCVGTGGGHRLINPDRSVVWGRAVGPWTVDEVDGYLAPHADGSRTPIDLQEQSLCALHRRFGWTALACWDRTGDQRYGSVSVFIFNEPLEFDAALTRARQAWPGVCARIEAAAEFRLALSEGE